MVVRGSEDGEDLVLMVEFWGARERCVFIVNVFSFFLFFPSPRLSPKRELRNYKIESFSELT